MHVHQNKKRKLGREKTHREMMLRNLVSSVILYEKVKTTEAKAKEVKGIIDKVINIGKKNNLSARRKLLAYLPQKEAVEKILKELIDVCKNRNSGYTRIVKLGRRNSDGAKMVQIELLDVGLKKKSKSTSKDSKEKKEKNKKDNTKKSSKEKK